MVFIVLYQKELHLSTFNYFILINLHPKFITSKIEKKNLESIHLRG